MSSINSLLDYEFRDIFCRVATKIDLRGANTPQEINQRLLQNIKAYPPRLSRSWIVFLKRLFPGFGPRSIDQAIAKPRGIIALTLKYGKKTADRIALKQTRNKLENLRKRAKNKK